MFEGWAAAAAIGGTVIGAGISAAGAQSAANTQADAARSGQQISMQQYQDQVNRNAPFTQAGYGALSNLDYLLGIGPQTSSGAPVSYGGSSNASGIDPSTGFHIGTGGGINQLIPNAVNSAASGYNNAANGAGAGTPAAATPAPGATTVNGQPSAVAGGTYGSLLKPFDTTDWQQLSPAYNFQKQQGMQGVLNGSAAGQGALSGAAYKDLIDYNQNEANTSFNSAFNQYQTQQGNIYSRLSGIVSAGQNSANNTGIQGTALAGQAAQAAVAQGSYLGAGTVASANALSGAANSAAPWLYGSANTSGDLVPGQTNNATASGGQLWG